MFFLSFSSRGTASSDKSSAFVFYIYKSFVGGKNSLCVLKKKKKEKEYFATYTLFICTRKNLNDQSHDVDEQNVIYIIVGN